MARAVRRSRQARGARRGDSAARPASDCARRSPTLDLFEELVTIKLRRRPCRSTSDQLERATPDADAARDAIRAARDAPAARGAASREAARDRRRSRRRRGAPTTRRRYDRARRGRSRAVARANRARRRSSPSTPRRRASTTWSAELVGISLAVTPGEAAYIPLASPLSRARPSSSIGSSVLERLRAWLEGASTQARTSAQVRRAHILENYGIELGGIAHDSMLESYVLNSTATRHDMDSRCERSISGLHDRQVRGRGRQRREADPLRRGRHRYGHALRGRGRRRYVAPALGTLASARAGAGPRARLSRDREAADRRAREDGAFGRHGRRADAAAPEPGARRDDGNRGARAHAAAGGPFNLGSPKQLQESALRAARVARARQDAERAAVDGRERAAGAGRQLRPAAPRLGIPRARQAEVDVYGQAAARDQPANRADPHVLSSSRRRHRAAFVVGSEPAEHPDPHARRPADPPSVRRAAGDAS